MTFKAPDHGLIPVILLLKNPKMNKHNKRTKRNYAKNHNYTKKWILGGLGEWPKTKEEDFFRKIFTSSMQNLIKYQKNNDIENINKKI